jgi:hypothetical protein
MDLPGLLEVIHVLGAKHRKPMVSQPNISISCPFAPYIDEDPESDRYMDTYHKYGTDNKPSLSISINDRGRSVFACWTCKCQGTLEDMIDWLNRLSDWDYADLMWFVAERETDLHQANLNDTDTARLYDRRSQGVFIYGEKELKQFSTDYHPYLKTRNVSKESAKRWGLLWSKDGGQVVFPVRNKQGRLVGAMWREVGRKRYRPVPGLKFDLLRFLYGEHLIEEDWEYVIVVEGQFDAIALDQHGFNTVAVMGSSVKRGQIGTLERFKGEVILLLDGNAAGRAGAKAAKERLPKARIIHLPDGVEPDGMDPDELEKLIWG